MEDCSNKKQVIIVLSVTDTINFIPKYYLYIFSTRIKLWVYVVVYSISVELAFVLEYSKSFLFKCICRFVKRKILLKTWFVKLMEK